MRIDRRTFVLLSGGAVAATLLRAQPIHSPTAQWISYPGQLAAYRHARRMRLAMDRCVNVGYPANYRQRISEAYFRKIGSVDHDIPLSWAGPIGRIRVSAGGQEGDITSRHGMLRAGQVGIEVHIDFADGLPCLRLEGNELSTGPTWEASLDGEHWVLAETSVGVGQFHRPDEVREVIVSLPVSRIVDPPGRPLETYFVEPGREWLLDFRETELGTLRFDARGRGHLGVQVGESVPEVRDPDPANFEQYPIEPVALTDQGTSVVLPERVLRFVRFYTSGPAELTNVRFDASLWPAQQKGQFESSDPDLNAIWSVAVATLRSNMHDFYLDGIRRDGLVWHDGTLTLEAYERVFYDSDLSRQTLIAETLPEHPSIRDMGIIDAPMYAVVGFERELAVRGDPAFSLMFRDRIEAIMQLYTSLQDERGFVDASRVKPYGFFPDWTATEKTGPDAHASPAYGQMLLAGAFAAAARLARAWGDDDAKARYEAQAKRLRVAVRKAFWLPQRGLFANGLDKLGNLDSRVTSFAQAFAVVFDIADPAEYDSLFTYLDNPSNRVPHFSLSQVIELTAYIKAGRAQGAVNRLKQAWLPMINNGYNRFFEDVWPEKDPVSQLAMYGRKYANSLCHAWSGAAPVMALSRGVLGVEPVEPGYRICTVKPQLCGLEWVRGSVPAPTGLIEVEWKGHAGQFTLPTGVIARLDGGRSVAGPGRFPLVLK
jgi:alpha-L-rhamnosidase